ncbi:rhomboid-like protein [Streptomyces sp. NPDC001435]|uniref:rhomboid-like protein n=1 Tax=unclassified Streptomyces TaxID=2593676 RepID=UPI0036924C2F
MEPTATAGTTASPPPPGTPLSDDSALSPTGLADLLDGMPRQRGAMADGAALGAPPVALAAAIPAAAPFRSRTAAPAAVAPVPAQSFPAQSFPAGSFPAPHRLLARRLRALHPWRLLPTPTGTPFTFAYAALLAVTSLIAADAAPGLMHSLYQASSTDVAHLVRTPVQVLLASALWIAGGVVSPYAMCFLVVLTALERRIGGLRAATVFLLGHVLATLATEVPVGIAVLAGHLPGSSLHRLDYGISFGVAASTGALAGLLTPWLRWPVVALFGGMLLQDLIAYTDPMTNWGHLISLTIGIAMWPALRRRHRARAVRPVRPTPTHVVRAVERAQSV